MKKSKHHLFQITISNYFATPRIQDDILHRYKTLRHPLQSDTKRYKMIQNCNSQKINRSLSTDYNITLIRQNSTILYHFVGTHSLLDIEKEINTRYRTIQINTIRLLSEQYKQKNTR